MPLRVRAIFIGLLSLVLGLSAASYLISVLFVLLHFEGSAKLTDEIVPLPQRCALVFGSAIKKGGEPGPAILRRVNTAVKLYEEGRVGTLIMSGDILLEEKSTSTLENIKFTQDVLRSRCTSVLAVSDRYHLARIKLLASRLDSPLETFPATAPQNPLLEFRDVAREGAAILYYLPFLVSRF